MGWYTGQLRRVLSYHVCGHRRGSNADNSFHCHHEDDCPIPQHKLSEFVYAREDGATSVVHADGLYIRNGTYPYKFPVKVCSINIASLSTCRLALDEGAVVLSFHNKSFPVPRVKLDPKRFLLIGNTGLRSMPKNVGLGDCKGPKVYGIPQCEVNFFTEADLNVQNLPNPNITGDFQATEAWPFKELSDDA